MALLVFLGLVALQSARMGIAGFIVELAQRDVDRLTSSPRPQGMREISRVASYFTDSLGYVPDNPWALERLGALDLARMRLSKARQEALAYTQDARLRFRQALRQRPASPFLWANLALSKLYLDEIDAEFFAALRHAGELGPWEPTAQQTVLFVGLAAWEKLDSGLRQSVVRALERGASRNGAKMFGIVKNFRRFDLVCGMKSYDVISGADCRKAAETVKSRASIKKGNR